MLVFDIRINQVHWSLSKRKENPHTTRHGNDSFGSFCHGKKNFNIR